ncbi:MAG: amino acid permease [Acidobacteria bacterium]|nr:amino acid permease [Acidobacteriota bacterium]
MASEAFTEKPSAGEPVKLVRGLGLMDSTTLVVGSMIGSGIFIVTADVARQLPSPGLMLTTWVVTAIITMIGAICYGELAAAMPQSGGQYVFLREGFGPLTGFVFGWTLFLVIQTGTVAAVAIAFAKFAGVILPSISSASWLWHIGTFGPYSMGALNIGPYDVGLNTQNLLAILSIALLTAVNCFGVRLGVAVQNLFTFTKTGALLILALLGIWIGSSAEALQANYGNGNFWGDADWSMATLTLIAVAMVGPVFAADAWYYITYTGEEVKNPRRNLPLSLLLGTGIVCAIYILTNFVYLQVLPLQGSPDGQTLMVRGIQYAAEDRVGIAAAQVIFGSAGLYLMAAAIMISTFGCNNGLILAGARVFYAMACDKLFFQSAAQIHPKSRTPVTALIIQGLLASILTLSGTYGQLLDYITFASLLFLMLTLAVMFTLRRRVGFERPVSAWGFPWLPILYFILVGFMEINLLIYKPLYTWPGLVIVLLGIPVYYLWRWRGEGRGN